MQLGLSSFSYGWAVGVAGFASPAAPLDAFGLLSKAREHGVSLVQLGDNLAIHRLTDDERCELKARAKERGVALELGARGLSPAHLERNIAVAHELGAKLLRFVIDEGEFEPSFRDVVGTLKNALPSLGELRIGIENHDRFAARTLRALVEEVDDERVGICLDTANSFGACEGLREVVPVLAPHTLNWHIKDYAIARVPHQMGFSIEGRAVGEGLLDLDFVARHLDEIKCRSAILELWTPPETRL